MIKLFTVGFPRETDELQLLGLFSDHGLVNTLTIIRDQTSGESKGYAFVEMLDKAGADRAIAALDGSVMGGRTLSVRIAEDKRQAPHAAERPFRSPELDQTQRNPEPSQAGKAKRPRRNKA